MYLAELHGKLSPKTERKEDLLTSNVFSFLKYSNREIFLKEYLRLLGYTLSQEAANNAKFIFWPRFAEGTEPDLVIIVGKYYILIEAKYFSAFDEESNLTRAQLIREIEVGKLEAKTNDKEFRLIAITADHYYKKEKFEVIPRDFMPLFTWTNWQTVTFFLEDVLEKETELPVEQISFVLDLHDLLDRKNLRGFRGCDCFANLHALTGCPDNIFFEAVTAIFRGSFIGFANSLSYSERMNPINKTIFWHKRSGFFISLIKVARLKPVNSHVFFKRDLKYD
jgi:hypothetical protein